MYSIDATHINQVGVYVLCSLVLTNQVRGLQHVLPSAVWLRCCRYSLIFCSSQALFIISEKDDSKHQAYALSEIICSPSLSDPTMIYIEPKTVKSSLLRKVCSCLLYNV